MKKAIAISLLLLSSVAFSQTMGGQGSNFQALVPPSFTISGNTILKNGAAWSPKGVNISGFAQPPAYVTGTFLTYQAAFPSELYMTRLRIGGDTIRFGVSQFGLDPQSSAYDPTYQNQIRDKVNQIVVAGFVVIIVMGAQNNNGGTISGLATTMPGSDTIRAWQTLVPLFKNHPSIMFEVYNEPALDTSIPSKTTWASTHNPVIAAIRAMGANNILILDGLNYAEYTSGLGSTIIDSANRWAFGIHPYFTGSDTSANWDTNFGNEAITYPTTITEWTATPTIKCQSSEPTLAANLLAYSKSHGGSAGLGIIGWAVDYPASLYTDMTSYVLTSYTGWTACADGTTTGPGLLISGY